MISLKIFHILDLECIKEEIVQSQHCNGIFKIETKHEGPEEIIGSLNGSSIFSFSTLSNINSFFLHIHSDLELHILDDGLAYFFPIIFEWSHPVGRNKDGMHLVLGVGFLIFVVLFFCRFDKLLRFHC